MILSWLYFVATEVKNCPTGSGSDVCTIDLPQVHADTTTVTSILQMFVFPAIGAIAVFFIMLAGLKLVTAQGDPQSVAKARKTIIYAALGLVIVLSAEAIVTWVIGRL